MIGKIFGDDLTPEDRGFENIGLVYRADATSTRSGRVDRNLSDALDLACIVDHRVDGLLFTIFNNRGGLGLAEINAPS